MRPVDEAEDTFRVLTTDLFATRETILIANFKPPLHREDSLADRAAISKFSLRPPFAECNVRVCDLMKTSPESLVPLCVDLDGTLIHTDVLWEGIKFLLGRKPLTLLGLLPLLRNGRAPFKRAVSASSTVSLDSLPWRESLVEWLRTEAAGGRPVYLVTAADAAYSRAVTARLGFFTGALASDGALNLKANKKARRLVEAFGEGGFDYIGDARADIPVWRAARSGICVKAHAGFVRRAGLAGKVEERFTDG